MSSPFSFKTCAQPQPSNTRGTFSFQSINEQPSSEHDSLECADDEATERFEMSPPSNDNAQQHASAATSSLQSSPPSTANDPDDGDGSLPSPNEGDVKEDDRKRRDANDNSGVRKRQKRMDELIEIDKKTAKQLFEAAHEALHVAEGELFALFSEQEAEFEVTGAEAQAAADSLLRAQQQQENSITAFQNTMPAVLPHPDNAQTSA